MLIGGSKEILDTTTICTSEATYFTDSQNFQEFLFPFFPGPSAILDNTGEIFEADSQCCLVTFFGLYQLLSNHSNLRTFVAKL